MSRRHEGFIQVSCQVEGVKWGVGGLGGLGGAEAHVAQRPQQLTGEYARRGRSPLSSAPTAPHPSHLQFFYATYVLLHIFKVVDFAFINTNYSDDIQSTVYNLHTYVYYLHCR